ncbi:hypothetical protein CLV68_6468 [Actinokineospora cianjurensis]|uniref:Uncharacterized protein n=1 Tax=Actinokineospora cianjurensis TaxID=585224 RepID=A0A421AW74_9PSEU|nr:hypothetical protein CLV68_6468 [Actinokineospora cianjurensis]
MMPGTTRDTAVVPRTTDRHWHSRHDSHGRHDPHGKHD